MSFEQETAHTITVVHCAVENLGVGAEFHYNTYKCLVSTLRH